MGMDEKLDLILNQVTDMKADISDMKVDISDMKTDISTMKSDIRNLNEKVDHLENQVTDVRLILENETSKSLARVMTS